MLRQKHSPAITYLHHAYRNMLAIGPIHDIFFNDTGFTFTKSTRTPTINDIAVIMIQIVCASFIFHHKNVW
jgi:hypothetical protein